MTVRGVNTLGVFLAALTIFMTGFVFYAVLFQELWLEAMGISMAEAEAGGEPGWMAAGFLISLAIALGLSMLLAWRNWPGLGGAAACGAAAAILFGAAVEGYDLVYTPEHSWTLFWIDSLHHVVGWTLAAMVLSLLKPKT